MRRFRKRILLILIISLAGVFTASANMPVIDVTAIAQAVTSYVQTIKEWNAQVQQWKSEFDRIEKAAKGLSSGDFTQIVSGLASLTTQMSSWHLSENLFNSYYIDKALSATGNGSYSLLRIMNNSQILENNIDYFVDTISSQIKKWSEKDADGNSMWDNIYTSSGVLGTGAKAGSEAAGMSSLISNLLLNILKQGGDITTEAASIINEMAGIFQVSPEEYASFYKKIQKETLSQATDGKASDTSGIDSLRTKAESDLSAAVQEKAKLSAQEETAVQQAESKIASYEKLVAEYKELEDWSRKMDEAITGISENQSDYEAAQSHEERKIATEKALAARSEYTRQEAQRESSALLDKYLVYINREEN